MDIPGVLMKRYRVQIDQPYSYVVLAENEEAARRQGIQRWRDRVPAQVGEWPTDITVEEIKVTAMGPDELAALPKKEEKGN